MPKKRADVEKPEPVTLSEYLRTSPTSLLQNFALERLNRAAVLQKDLRFLLDQIIEASAEANLAQMVMEHRKQLFAPQKTASAAELLAEIVGDGTRLIDAGKTSNGVAGPDGRMDRSGPES